MILASQSPRRIELMRDAGFDITIIPADIDEAPLPGESPFELVKRLARNKAEAVAGRPGNEDELVVAADTIVALDSAIMGKPRDHEDACAMLRRLSGRTHQVATGVCILNARKQAIDSFVCVTDVTFFELTDREIRNYVATGEADDKAGSYGIQGLGGRLLVKSINGDFYNVVGLPIAEVVRRIEKLRP